MKNLTAKGSVLRGNQHPTQILTFHLATVLRKYSSEFIGVQETRFLLSAME